jgi:arylsulfatase A-like enzyme
VPAKNVIVIVVEGLHAGMVGAYGNSWIRTSTLDDLACESFLFDQAYVTSPRVEEFYRATWLADASLPQRLRAGGLHAVLLTDSSHVVRLPGAAAFSEQLFIDAAAESQSAGDVSETGMARLFGAAADWLAEAREPFCLWVHSRGMLEPWDAPLEMRNRFAEEDDPEPPSLVETPNLWLPDDCDPDEPLGIKHAYAGQVSLLDMCLGALLDGFAEGPLAATTKLTFLSASGFPLGEHRRIGACDEALYNELTQLVWMMRFPDGQGKLARTQALVQPSDLPGTLLEALEFAGVAEPATVASSLLPLVRGEIDALRDRLILVGPHDRAVRTPAWHLRQPITGAAELYAKPSDRWEVNEVAKLLPEVAAGLAAVLSDSSNSKADDAAVSLPEILTSEFD